MGDWGSGCMGHVWSGEGFGPHLAALRDHSGVVLWYRGIESQSAESRPAHPSVVSLQPLNKLLLLSFPQEENTLNLKEFAAILT